MSEIHPQGGTHIAPPAAHRSFVGDIVNVKDHGSAVVVSVPAPEIVVDPEVHELVGVLGDVTEVYPVDPVIDVETPFGVRLRVRRVDATQGAEVFEVVKGRK